MEATSGDPGDERWASELNNLLDLIQSQTYMVNERFILVTTLSFHASLIIQNLIPECHTERSRQNPFVNMPFVNTGNYLSECLREIFPQSNTDNLERLFTIGYRELTEKLCLLFLNLNFPFSRFQNESLNNLLRMAIELSGNPFSVELEMFEVKFMFFLEDIKQKIPARETSFEGSTIIFSTRYTSTQF